MLLRGKRRKLCLGDFPLHLRVNENRCELENSNIISADDTLHDMEDYGNTTLHECVVLVLTPQDMLWVLLKNI